MCCFISLSQANRTIELVNLEPFFSGPAADPCLALSAPPVRHSLILSIVACDFPTFDCRFQSRRHDIDDSEENLHLTHIYRITTLRFRLSQHGDSHYQKTVTTRPGPCRHNIERPTNLPLAEA